MVPDERRRMDSALVATVEETAEIWRSRLMDVSWFMRSLNDTLPERPIGKISAQAGSGREVLSLRLYWMSQHLLPVWPMSI